ncbi:SAM-dependent methyltransferase [Uliginosibacterium sp. sgz301328]|uniref:SAM-dependent methyltransferase n=1 Tax=Uliginosibacterium sp. sgz301328 TaxID=3243764 RepID=UPI00359D81E2
MATGTLYLIPVGLGPSDVASTQPAGVAAVLGKLDCFIVERAKTARAEIKRLGHPAAIQSLTITELPERLDGRTLDELLAPAREGRDIGLMSEAGCPAVADPGALVVRRAHERGIRVAPMVGPSSLLLGLMASGLNGQSFAFHGYLPVAAGERTQRIKQLERESAKLQRTQLFIETPYRNDAMFDALLQACEPSTLLCVARALTTSDEWVSTRSIGAWKKSSRPDLARQPTVFLLLAS